MDQSRYPISQFARKASVSERTLRYYDNEGLLSPSHHSEAGYRLYTDADLLTLQYILALKYLGFSLSEIKICLQTGPQHLPEVLAQQKAMLLEKRSQLNAILHAIEETEQLLRADAFAPESLTKLIEVIQMEQQNAWAFKHLTPEQQHKMKDLFETAYSEESKQKVRARTWSAEDSERHNQQYAKFRTELTRLVALGADPSGPEALELAQLLADLNNRYSQGDPGILEGMKKTWESYNALPDDQKPTTAYKIPDEERAFIKQAMTHFYRNKVSQKP